MLVRHVYVCNEGRYTEGHRYLRRYLGMHLIMHVGKQIGCLVGFNQIGLSVYLCR